MHRVFLYFSTIWMAGRQISLFEIFLTKIVRISGQNPANTLHFSFQTLAIWLGWCYINKRYDSEHNLYCMEGTQLMFGQLIEKLQASPQTIVFTEGTDARILQASARLLSSTFPKPILICT